MYILTEKQKMSLVMLSNPIEIIVVTALQKIPHPIALETVLLSEIGFSAIITQKKYIYIYLKPKERNQQNIKGRGLVHQKSHRTLNKQNFTFSSLSFISQ